MAEIVELSYWLIHQHLHRATRRRPVLDPDPQEHSTVSSVAELRREAVSAVPQGSEGTRRETPSVPQALVPEDLCGRVDAQIAPLRPSLSEGHGGCVGVTGGVEDSDQESSR